MRLTLGLMIGSSFFGVEARHLLRRGFPPKPSLKHRPASRLSSRDLGKVTRKEVTGMSGSKDKVKGGWDQAKGRAKEAVGDATGNRELQTKGKKDQVKGGVKKAIGSAKEAGRNVKRAVEDAS